MKYKIRDQSKAGFKRKVPKRPKTSEADRMFGKSDLMLVLQEKLGCNIREARVMAQAVTASILESLLKGVSVSIRGVGIIGFKFRAGRNWTSNFGNGDFQKSIPNRLVPKFYASSTLKKSISEAPFQEQVKNIQAAPLSA